MKCMHQPCEDQIGWISGDNHSCWKHAKIVCASRWASTEILVDNSIYCKDINFCRVCSQAKQFYKELKKHRAKCKHDQSYTMTYPKGSQQCYMCGTRRDEMPGWVEPKKAEIEDDHMMDDQDDKPIIFNDKWVHALRNALKNDSQKNELE